MTSHFDQTSVVAARNPAVTTREWGVEEVHDMLNMSSLVTSGVGLVVSTRGDLTAGRQNSSFLKKAVMLLLVVGQA